MVINYCRAYGLFGEEQFRRRAQHGLKFVEERHWDEIHQAYNWTLSANEPADQTNHCYGLAFVLLMYAAAYDAKVTESPTRIEDTFELLESRFWLEGSGIYADEASADWAHLSAYRGQNANMHTCEAMLAAYEATQGEQYLNRAQSLARKFTVELAGKSDGLVWEHFTQQLEIDWSYNKDDPKNLYRPWGFQPGHQTEWAKLLLNIYQHRPEQWMIDRATELFDRALDKAWDGEYGGIQYGFNLQGEVCDDEKYFWVQAESFAAAARLAVVTGDEKYWGWYGRIWDYAERHMIDDHYGAWFRVLDRKNNRVSDQKSTAGGKCDYHTIGACWDVLRTAF